MSLGAETLFKAVKAAVFTVASLFFNCPKITSILLSAARAARTSISVGCALAGIVGIAAAIWSTTLSPFIVSSALLTAFKSSVFPFFNTPNKLPNALSCPILPAALMAASFTELSLLVKFLRIVGKADFASACPNIPIISACASGFKLGKALSQRLVVAGVMYF